MSAQHLQAASANSKVAVKIARRERAQHEGIAIDTQCHGGALQGPKVKGLFIPFREHTCRYNYIGTYSRGVIFNKTDRDFADNTYSYNYVLQLGKFF